MLTFKIHGENIVVTDAIRSSIEEKLEVLHKYATKPTVISINVRTYPNGEAKVEATVPFKDTLHAEDRSCDLYNSIDNVVEKLDKQARRMKTKTINQQQDHTPLKKLFN